MAADHHRQGVRPAANDAGWVGGVRPFRGVPLAATSSPACCAAACATRRWCPDPESMGYAGMCVLRGRGSGMRQDRCAFRAGGEFRCPSSSLSTRHPQLAKALKDVRKANAAHDAVATQITDDQEMLDTLATDYAAKTISHREWLSARKPIQTRIDSARRRLSRVSPTHSIEEYVGRSGLLRDAWADLPLTRQAAIIRTLLDTVEVAPAVRGRNRFDPDRLTPTWRL